MITYYHQLDPFLIQIGPNLGIRWYSLAYITGAFLAYWAGVYLIRKGRLRLPEVQLMDIVVYGAMGAVLGGRLGYCLFYSPDLFLSFDKSFPFWGVLKIHRGGMASHGGILGLLVFQYIYAYRHRISVFSMMDLGAVAGSVGMFFGRIANFINGELYGRIVESSVWFGVKFPTEIYLWLAYPKIYKENLISLKETFPVLEKIFSSNVRIPQPFSWEQWVSKAAEGDATYQSYISYIGGLIVQSANETSIKQILEPLLFLRYPSQLYQSLLGGLLTFIIISLFWLKDRKAGFISLVWICSYLFLRIVTELYRQPDVGIGFQFLHLTRGQWLSICFYGIVLIYGYFVYKQHPKGFKL